MKVIHLHPWNILPGHAVPIQKKLASLIIEGGSLPQAGTVLGIDVSYGHRSDLVVASAVLLTFPELELLNSWTVRGHSSFPYVPGLLSFREIPALLPLLKEVPAPDFIMVDGQGIAHPRGIGLASHIGLMTRTPSIGCAKSRLVGEFREPGAEAGSHEPLTVNGRLVGYALRSRKGCKPLIISPGHLLSPKQALLGVMKCLKGYRLPEPTRLADRLTKEVPRPK